MADEITIRTLLNLTNGYLDDENDIGAKRLTQTNGRIFKRVVDVGTSEETLTFTDITTPGWCYLINLDSTNYVQVGVSTGVYFTRLKAAEPGGLFRLENAATTLYLKANTATCKILVVVYDN